MPKLGRPITVIELSEEEREQLEGLVRRRRAAKADVQRARVVLLSAEGSSGKDIARRVGLSEPTVVKWRRRFLAHRCLGLSELPKSGAPRRVSDGQLEEIIRQTLESAPTAATHWSTRAMAKRCGFSRQTVSRIWRTFGLAPHRSESFTLSKDPYFVDKVRDVVGLYLDPPANALVLCVDEKTQVQALERSQPVLPMRPGQPERRTHDYYRHGTLSLFAALEVATGRIISATKPKHRSAEFLAFLRQVEKAVTLRIPSPPSLRLSSRINSICSSAMTSTHWQPSSSSRGLALRRETAWRASAICSTRRRWCSLTNSISPGATSSGCAW
jgi:transposase